VLICVDVFIYGNLKQQSVFVGHFSHILPEVSFSPLSGRNEVSWQWESSPFPVTT
jgi:hypothetical protein